MWILITCSDCQTGFKYNAVGGFRPQRCPPCRIARKRQTDREKAQRWREANPERNREHQNKSNRKRLADPQHLKWKRDAYNRKHYGLEPEDILELLEAQKHLCAICGNGHVGPGDRLHIDHNHVTGAVRALLCGKCNTLIGLADDSPERLEIAAAYLRRHMK